MSVRKDQKKVTAASLRARKGQTPIVALTAYDHPTALVLDEAGIDFLLVGDSLGTVIAGEANTLAVTLEQTIQHTRYVAAGARYALVVADLPFLTYEISVEEARRNAGRCIKEGGAGAVKLEGGTSVRDRIEAIVRMDIPVMGHVGLTPQSIHRFGGMRVQGKDEITRMAILEDARAVADAGAFCVVIEGVPRSLGQETTETINIPTIGIGAGAGCDGQILVTHDMLGLTPGRKPAFVKEYRSLGDEIRSAAQEFAAEVREGIYPGAEYGYDG